MRPRPLDLHDLSSHDRVLSTRTSSLLTALLALAVLAAARPPAAVLAGAAVVTAALLALAELLDRQARERGEARERLEAVRAERDRLRGMLERQDRLSSLGLLAAGVAHEINNPMSYVTSNVGALAEALARCDALPPDLRAYADELLRDTLDGARRVTAIVADLRAYAREGDGPFAPFDLNAEVQAALRIAGGQLGPRCQVALTLGKLPPAFGHAGRIGQVLVNLLVNAAQAIPGRGRVAVTTRCDPDELLVEVRDDGAGMPPEVVARLFQPFFTTKPPGQGTGLGLAVAQGIVRRHGGRIAVVSAPGQGSTFTVHLPRVRLERETSVPAPAAARAPVPVPVPATATTTTAATAAA